MNEENRVTKTSIMGVLTAPAVFLNDDKRYKLGSELYKSKKPLFKKQLLQEKGKDPKDLLDGLGTQVMRISNDKFWRWTTLMGLEPIVKDVSVSMPQTEDKPATIGSKVMTKKKDKPIVSDMLSGSKSKPQIESIKTQLDKPVTIKSK